MLNLIPLEHIGPNTVVPRVVDLSVRYYYKNIQKRTKGEGKIAVF